MRQVERLQRKPEGELPALVDIERVDKDDFYRSIGSTLRNEGGYSADARDPGGETKFGISKRQYPHLNIKDLTLEDAQNIYWKDYWEPEKLEQISDLKIKVKIFDLTVNMGAAWAHRLIQRALRSTGFTVEENGHMDDPTIRAINKADKSDLLAALKSESAGHYRTLVITNPKLVPFVKGWLNRSYE